MTIFHGDRFSLETCAGFRCHEIFEYETRSKRGSRNDIFIKKSPVTKAYFNLHLFRETKYVTLSR